MSNPARKLLLGLTAFILLFLVVVLGPKVRWRSKGNPQPTTVVERQVPQKTNTPEQTHGTGPTRADPVYDTYIANAKTKKFHRPTCPYLPDQSNQISFDTRDEALDAGYTPCGHCNP